MKNEKQIQEIDCSKHKKGVCSIEDCMNRKPSRGICPKCEKTHYRNVCQKNTCPRKKEKKDTLMFCYINIGRLQVDARETYYWLKLRDKKIADEFLGKVEVMEASFKKEKEKKDMLNNSWAGKMEWGEPEKTEKTKEGTVKIWWKKLRSGL